MKKHFFGILFFFLFCPVHFINAQGVETDLLKLAKVQTGVKSKRESSYDRAGKNKDRIEGIKPGEKRTIFDVKGAGIINHIWITINLPPEQLNRNDIIIRMYWDGNEYPSVESPIGPFFGQGWNESYPFSSLPLAAGPVDGRGLVSYFTMPFNTGAKIEIENQNDIDIRAFYFYIDYLELQKLPGNYGRFHAWYNHETTKPVKGDGVNIDGKDNYLIADIRGKGQFVGVNYYVHSPTTAWYGEGDDMIFVDGDELPTLKGTGTEDYFNTAWCPNELFQHPYYGYARVNKDIGWLGRTHVYRFHISDPIYFDKSLKFTIEHGHANDLGLDLGSVAYWYQEKAAPLPTAPTKQQRKLKPMIGIREIHKWRNEWLKSRDNDSLQWN